MSVARRTWLPLSMLAAGLAGLGVLAWELGASDAAVATERVAAGTELRSTGAASAASDESTGGPRDDAGRRGEAPEIAARREVDEPQLSPLQRDELRRLEQGGCARFWGTVLAPDGAPCEGATLFVEGFPSTTSDTRGAWSVDVEHDVGGVFEYGTLRASTSIVARKEGVGIAAARLIGPSRRVDLTLSAQGGHRLTGLCVDRVSRERVAGARVEMVFANDAAGGDTWGLRLATEADERGRFAFAGIPSGTFDLRGRAGHHDTNGWVPLDFGGARDRDYTLLFEPTIELSGTFAPWPPADGAAAGAAAPRVVVNTASPQDSRSEEEPREFTADVDAAGAFVCRIPNCPRFVARLVAGTGALWKVQIDPDVEPHDVDFGRIELGPTCCVRGRVLLPPAFQVLQPEVRLNHFGMDVAAPVDADGGFSIGPVPLPESRYFDFELAFPGRGSLPLRRAATTDEGNWAPCLREDADFVAPDLVPVNGYGGWLGGRVIDDAGDPVAFAQFRAATVGEPEERWSYAALSDGRGRFLIQVDVDEAGHAPPLEIAIAARGFRQQRFRTAPSTFSCFLWCEAKLARGERLHGTLVDEGGGPLVGWRVGFVETDEQLKARQKDHESIYVGWNSRLAGVITDALGEFDCFSLEGNSLRANLQGPDGRHSIVDSVPVVAGSISLRYIAADAPSTSR